MEQIVWQRWVVYCVFGIPFLAWVFFSRNNAGRLAAVLAIEVFVQESLAARRYLWAIGVGPSLMTMYVALVACLMSRRRFPSLGSLVLPWLLFLSVAVTSIVLGAWSEHLLEVNVVRFQTLYVEALLFFLLGTIGLVSEDEVKQFCFFFVLIGLGAALGHYLTLITGYRFADFAQRGDPATSYIYGGFFNNPNTLGSFYCMAIPIALLLLTAGSLPPARRLIAVVSLLAMVGSLLLSVHRGGILTTAVLSLLVVGIARERPGRAIVIAIVGMITILASYWLVATLLPDLTASAWDLAGWKGFSSPRIQMWPVMIQIAFENPFGIGLADQNLQPIAIQHGTDTPSAHNIYLTLALQTGFLGLAAFLFIVGTVIARARRAWRWTSLPDQQQALTLSLFAILSFLMVGFTEPIWENGEKLNHIFWLFCGISLGTSARVLNLARQRTAETQQPTTLEEAQASGF